MKSICLSHVTSRLETIDRIIRNDPFAQLRFERGFSSFSHFSLLVDEKRRTEREEEKTILIYYHQRLVEWREKRKEKREEEESFSLASLTRNITSSTSEDPQM